MVAKKTVAGKVSTKAAEEKATEGKEEAVKAGTKKTAKTTAPKTAAKKTTARRTAAKKPEVTRQVFVQFGGREVAAMDIMHKVEAAWAAMGNMAEDMTDVKVYIKPEENMAYYVINGDVTGGVEM